MNAQDNATPPVAGVSLCDALDMVRAWHEPRRQRLAELAAKAPAWAQRIGEADQNNNNLFRLYVETVKSAANKGYELFRPTVGGYNLRRGRKVLLEGRPLHLIVEYLGALNIWNEILAGLATKAPAWALRIEDAEQKAENFFRLRCETVKLAKTKGYEFSGSSSEGYSLRRNGKPVLRGRALFMIVEHLGAQDIWKDV
ncbi:MAG: hypothetical protein ACLPXB_00820 [Thiobacillaceae bacterium]